jgi:transposase
MARRREMAVREEDTTKTPTIYMALDLGHRRWTVGVLLPGDRDARLFQVAGGDREALSELIRRRRQMVGDPGVRVVSCYEAGRDGFWLHRWLRDQDIDNRVLDPASLEAPRRWRRVKTDRVDTLGLLRVLLRLERGETEMTRVIWVPAPAIEDARRHTRERERLVSERTAHRNRIQGLLAAQGMTATKVGARDWPDRLAVGCTGDGRTLGVALLAEIRRETERLALVEHQIKEVEAAQHVALKADTALAATACKLKRLKGLGEVFASRADIRGVLARLREPPPSWRRLRADAVAVGQRRHAQRPADQQGRQSAGTNDGDRMRLDVDPPSARQCSDAVVAEALCRWRQTGTPDRHRRTRPQADGRLVALSEGGSNS